MYEFIGPIPLKAGMKEKIYKKIKDRRGMVKYVQGLIQKDLGV